MIVGVMLSSICRCTGCAHLHDHVMPWLQCMVEGRSSGIEAKAWMRERRWVVFGESDSVVVVVLWALFIMGVRIIVGCHSSRERKR